MLTRAPVFLAGVVLAAAPALAASVAGPVVAVPDATLPEGAERAFARGIDDLAPVAGDAPPAALAKAEAALAAGERAYLDGRLAAAEKALSAAAEAWLEDATALADAGAATRTMLLLAQVRAAHGRRAEADQVLERALSALPGFPAGAAPPPPAVQRRLDGIRERLRPRMQGKLDVTSRPAGIEVRLNGVPAGVTPLSLGDLPLTAVRVRVAGRERLVNLARGPAEVAFELDPVPAREALRVTLLRPDATAGWAAAARLQAAGEADAVCVAVAGADDRVLVARIDPAGRQVLGARSAAAPAGAEGWRALGRLCGEAVPSDGPPDAALERLWPAAPAEPAGDDRRVWGWAALGAGAALVGVGVVFGLGALDAEEDFRNARTAGGARRARDDARTQAVVTDVSFGVAAGLLGAGIYLFLGPAP